MPTHTDIHIGNPWTTLHPGSDHYSLLGLSRERSREHNFLFAKRWELPIIALPTARISRIMSNLVSLPVRQELHSVSQYFKSVRFKDVRNLI